MKKRILSIVLSVALIAGTIMAAFPGVLASAAEGEFVYHTWSVAGDLLTALEKANGDASALEYGAIAYSGNYYGNVGVKSVKYALDTYSHIVTTGTNNAWQCQIQIPNNQGVGAGKNNQGVYIYIAENKRTQKLTFTAPVHGIYNFVPTAIGGPNAIEESIAVNNGSLTVGVNVKGESIGEMTLARGEKANLPEAKGVELEEGETIEVTFTAPTANFDSNAGNYCIVNFKVDIVDEIAPQVLITELETKSFNLVDVYSLTNTAAAVQPQKEGIFDYGYVSATGQSGSTLSTTAKSALYKEANGYSWYYGLFNGDESEYGVKIYKDTNKITFESKATAMEGFVITADKKGTYTLTSGAITKGGAGAMNLVVEDNAGNKLYSNGGNNADGLNITVEMDAGEKLYVFADRTNSDYNTSTITVTDLALDVTYIPTRYVDPVYNVNEYAVADELRNNTGSWPTAYQNPANFTYGGFLTSVAVTSGAVKDAFCRIYDSADPAYDKFSNEAQGYDNNTMEAYADGSMRWIYDFGGSKMGFKFTAPANAEYVLASDVFVGTGINAYVYSVAEDGTLTQVGETVAVSATKGLNIAFTATKDTTYAVVVGKSAGSWGNQRNCKTAWMTLTSTELVREGYLEELPLEYGDDPSYVFQYEKDLTNYAPELVEEAEYALADGTLSVTFPEAPENSYYNYNWAVWVEQDGLWVKLTTEDGLTFSVSGVTSDNGVYNTYILCTDDNGVTLLKSYDNYIDSVTAETVGNAVITEVSVNGNVVADRNVYVDLADGVKLSVAGVNVTAYTYTIGGVTYDMVDGVATLDIAEAGTYVVTVNAAAAEGKESASKTIEIVVYAADAEASVIDSVETTVTDNTVTVEAASDSADAFDYYLKPDVTGTGVYRTNSGNTSESFNMTGQYGYYYASVHAKNTTGNVDDVVIKYVNLARPGGEWKMNATVNGAVVKSNATVGETLNFAANASFAGIEDVEYMAFKKDANGTTVIKGWAAYNAVNFTPAYAGHYEITIAARAKGNAAYEVYRTFYIEVDEEAKATGTVSVSATNVAKNTPVTFTANAESSDALLYKFTIMSSGNAQVIQSYSVDNTCTWLPTKAGTYTVKVEVIGANSFGMYDFRGSETIVVA